jgi:hypothetical protein
MIVVAREGLHHAGRARQAECGTDEDELRARGHEPVDEGLGQPPVDVPRAARAALPAVAAGQVDVDVQAVLVRGVADDPVRGTEVPAARAAEVPDRTRGASGWRRR